MAKIISVENEDKKIKVGRVLIILILVALLAAFGYLLWTNKSKPAGTNNTNQAQQPRVQTTYEAARQKATSGDYGGAQAQLDQSLSSAPDAAKKADVYVSKALIAYNTKHYDDALQSAKSAEDLLHNVRSGRLVAQVYRAMGDKPNAVKYYQITLDRYSQAEKDASSSYHDDLETMQELQR